MKVTVYTIKDCTFSKQEKEYLNANKIVFEEKDLETNKDFLTEMLAISNNFAGTPVTRVEKDDGSIAVLKGFTKGEFDMTFGFTTAPTDSAVPGQVNDTPIATPPVVEVPSAEVVSPPPVTTPFDSAQVKPVETPVVTTPDPLKSVMEDLQAKAEPTMPTVEQSPIASPVSPPTVNDQPLDTTPVAPPADAPVIPDFPAK